MYTVMQLIYIEGRLDDAIPFVYVYPTLDAARLAIRETAESEDMGELEWRGDKNAVTNGGPEATSDYDAYTITEVELAQ